ncbi:rhomboid-domain-containing protein [Laetiporus sulphureus 93-53]|uniref:Rhomboid-type serine protease n=1 Tax=Laetiporus sulphureus 93-53 TaxID=1314785 RepID=A0A165DY10_9APHY|nr:rhomboid-domain-containing protein [Laetiporus sulphureus 93-53]KZT05852.1 rhomboid-domain-containing protein [Laetiporus sulphureus 93-53]
MATHNEREDSITIDDEETLGGSTLAKRGLNHSYSMSTTKLLADDEDTQRRNESSDSVYAPAYQSAYPDTDYSYDPAGYSTDKLGESRQDQIADVPKDAPYVQPCGEPYGKSYYQNMEYAEPSAAPPPPQERPNYFQRYFGLYPIEQRISDKKAGRGIQQKPYMVWALTLTMLCVLIYELVTNDKYQGTPISFKPTVNPMLGPSESALITLGARFPACMKNVSAIPITTEFACLNDTANPVTSACDLETICNFGGFHDKAPNQWFRFITPVFLHAGIIHYLLNMLAQMTVSAQVEREMGSVCFFILYIASGIFGNVLGGNFALVGVPSVGASGAIFGTTAVAWVDLFAHWRYQYRPGRKLGWMFVELILGIALGYIPYVDNFAHLGGLLMGLLTAMALYPIISPSSRHRAIVIGLRLSAVVLAIVLFVVLIRNFYTADPYSSCEWCRYLSCIPTSSNDHCQGTGLTYSSSST